MLVYDLPPVPPVDHRNLRKTIKGLTNLTRPALTTPILACLLALGALGALGALVRPASAQLISQFEPNEAVFSPDGDGNQDSTRITLILASDAAALNVIVFAADSVTAVDTLLSVTSLGAGGLVLSWTGKDFDGSPAPEGTYILTMNATGVSEPDTSITLPLFVDVTAPVLNVLLLEPPTYAPGAAGQPQILTVTFFLSGSTEADSLLPGDELTVEIDRPGDTPVDAADIDRSISFEPPFSGAPGSYQLKWDGNKVSPLSDGEHKIRLLVADLAGHSDVRERTFDLNLDGPEIEVTSMESNQSLRALPDSIMGIAYDRDGVDVNSLMVRYDSDLAYVAIPSVMVDADTVRFSFPVASVVSAEGEYDMTIRADDGMGRQRTVPFSLTLDVTAPGTPTLDPFSASWHTETFPLSARWEGSANFIRIYRGGVQIDSVLAVVVKSFRRDVPLEPARNVFRVTAVDVAGNESPASNEVVVTFDTAVGVFITAPFTPFDQFQINVARAGKSVTLRVYDMRGDLVVILNEFAPTNHFALVWNGLNGSGEITKKGPLVAVATVTYADGGRETFRELFLFDP